MISRRQFLLLSAAGCAAAFANPALARVLPPGERSLQFYNLHTGETLTTTYWAQGEYLSTELHSVNRLLRDYRNDEIATIDPRLLDQLCLLQHKVEHPGAFHVISGYRSPRTNAQLRRHDGGVAKGSLHMQGRAIDIRLPGVELRHLRQAALSLQAGGVGYYAQSNFIHLDTGRRRFW